ncbi:MAG: cyclase family protein [Bacteroidetes bacterium]|nr:MAG: cyclase family protein [Bacteroidota bacterium]TAG85469.1 MAG: cyclase family protein [Bacteroidota bacterium]
MSFSTFEFQYQDKKYNFNPLLPLDISLCLQNNTQNPNCYYAENPVFETICADNFIGNVAEGGSCNYQKITFTPHGNGTHTECYGHISADKNAIIPNCLNRFLFFAELISVVPQKINGDEIIFWEQIETKITSSPEAIILRTLPNLSEKKIKNYNQTNPPFLDEKVGTKLAEKNITHLLLDLPSLDKEKDEGKLLCHHNFWQYPNNIRKNATITELIFVPDSIIDGVYLLNLQVPSMAIDAVPSKPILYVLKNI